MKNEATTHRPLFGLAPDQTVQGPALFAPCTLRGITMRNRVVISPMQQYSASDGMANDWHLIDLARFALGGAGTVFVGATAVEPRGRNTHGDLGCGMTARWNRWRVSRVFCAPRARCPAYNWGTPAARPACRSGGKDMAP